MGQVWITGSGCRTSSGCSSGNHKHDGRGCHSTGTSHDSTNNRGNRGNGNDGANNARNKVQCGSNFRPDPDAKSGCAVIFSKTAPCPDGLARDTTSRLCINTRSRADSDDPNPGGSHNYCPDPKQYDKGDGRGCVVKSRDDDPDRSRYCPAGQVFYSTLGCRYPCDAGQILMNGACRTVQTTPRRPPNQPARCPVGYSGTPPNCVQDPLPKVFVLGKTVGEAAGTVDVTVALSHAATAAATVVFATSDGTATAGSDYTAITSRSVTIAAGAQTATVPVTIIDDTDDEADTETFTVTISNAAGGAELGASTSGTVGITDDDLPPPVAVSLAGARYEAQEGASLRFGVTLDAVSAEDVVVDYTVAAVTAEPEDFTQPLGRVTIRGGETTATVVVDTVDDTVHEPDETLTLTLTAAAGASLGTTTTATGVIVDNDPWTVRNLTMACTAASGSLRLDIDWDAPDSQANFTPYKAQIHTGDPVADTQWFDFLGARRVAWDTNVPHYRREARFPPRWVNTYRSLAYGETYTVRMRPALGAKTGTWSHATATCPTPPVVSLTPTEVSVGEDAGSAVFTVSLSKTWPAAVTVNVATADGTTAAGSDYTAITHRSVTIAVGAQTATVQVTILDDTDDEPDETFTVTVSAPTGGAQLGSDTHSTVTITDNDRRDTPKFLS